ncbi:MAG: hypothetical protein HYU86_11920 [Chloroflexi bacterium]|nr:hypothetical protein [Chloroflexota bacterium]
MTTVVVMMHRPTAEALRPPRTVHVRFPFGRPFGLPGHAEQQRVVVEDALAVLVNAITPGQIVDLPYRWRREDYARILAERASQGQKS